MSEVVDATAEDHAEAVRAAAAALRAGDLVVLPTDTVYGVAADAFDREGTQKVFRAKHRSRSFPLPVLVRSPKQVLGLVTQVPETAELLMAAYWPGPLTIVVASDPNLTWDLGDDEGTVALRMPMDTVTLDIIREVGPLAVTSANRSGRPPARTVDEAQQSLGEAVAVYVDGGTAHRRRPVHDRRPDPGRTPRPARGLGARRAGAGRGAGRARAPRGRPGRARPSHHRWRRRPRRHHHGVSPSSRRQAGRRGPAR